MFTIGGGIHGTMRFPGTERQRQGDSNAWSSIRVCAGGDVGGLRQRSERTFRCDGGRACGGTPQPTRKAPRLDARAGAIAAVSIPARAGQAFAGFPTMASCSHILATSSADGVPIPGIAPTSAKRMRCARSAMATCRSPPRMARRWTSSTTAMSNMPRATGPGSATAPAMNSNRQC